MKQEKDKRTRILDTAAKLFTKQPFHKVLLSDVATKAAVGKGTLYLYFKNKEDLYFAVVFREFSTLVERLRGLLARDDARPEEHLAEIIRILAEHLFRKAANLEQLGVVMQCPTTDEWRDKRREMLELIEGLIRRGVEQGVFEDENPRLSAQYIPALIRSVCLFKPEGANVESVASHASAFVLQGLRKRC